MSSSKDNPPSPIERDLGLTQVSVVRDLLSSDDQPEPRGGDAAESESPELQIGAHKYRILGDLGQGGMGRVYLAVDQDLGREVALKMMRVQDAAGARRFVEEARVIAKLDHPNIVPVYEVGITDEGRFFYTMRVVRGRTLSAVLDESRQTDEPDGELSLARMVQIFLQIGQGIEYAHSKGIVHSDLKPSNVMIGDHGEVLVLDWGLSRLAARAESGAGDTRAGIRRIAGTPQYMAPEQARGEDIDHRADVYAMGAILFEMLTLEPVFRGSTVEEVLEAVRSQKPRQPRLVSPQRSVPALLEAACLKALSKNPDERPQSAREFLDAVQTWLEAEADRERRRHVAREVADEGRTLLQEYFSLRDKLGEYERAAEVTRDSVKAWEPPARKESLLSAEDRVTAARRRLAEVASATVGTLEKALGHDNENRSAREALADFYWSQFQDAERAGREDDLAFFAGRVTEYHDGKYARELEGAGSLTLATEPSGATVTIHPLRPSGFVQQAGEPSTLGTTPLNNHSLEMGSYLLRIQHADHPAIGYPVHIGRNQEWSGTIRLIPQELLAEGFCFIPAGPFQSGGDPQARYSSPSETVELGDFLMGEHPVTMIEYLEYLNDLVSSDGMDAALARSPRRSARDPVTSYLETSADGKLQLPETDAEGDSWDPRLPAVGITWNDANAYCEWRSRRDRRSYRLPTELEWEKAARGVDGRWFPWGWRFDAGLCNVDGSRKERPAPVPVDEFPTDCSVYGVRGCAGNIEEWTSTKLIQGEGDGARVGLVVRGGGWNAVASYARCAARFDYAAESCSDYLGFRIVLELPKH